MNHHPISRLFLGLILMSAAPFLNPAEAAAADEYRPFEGEKSSWRDGFDRYDYLMDEETLDIQPFKRGEDEKFGIKDPPKGKRRCVVVVPKRAARATPGPGAVAIGITSRKPKWSCSSGVFTSPTSRPTRP